MVASVVVVLFVGFVAAVIFSLLKATPVYKSDQESATARDFVLLTTNISYKKPLVIMLTVDGVVTDMWHSIKISCFLTIQIYA